MFTNLCKYEHIIYIYTYTCKCLQIYISIYIHLLFMCVCDDTLQGFVEHSKKELTMITTVFANTGRRDATVEEMLKFIADYL